QRLLGRRPGDLGEVRDAGAAATGRGRLVLTNRHLSNPSRHRAAELFDPVPIDELHERALGVLALAPTGTGALALALPVERVDRLDAYVEDLLDSDLDRGLVRVRVHQERVPVLIELAVALLRDHGRDDDVARVGDRRHLSPSSSAAGTPRNSSSASV